MSKLSDFYAVWAVGMHGRPYLTKVYRDMAFESDETLVHPRVLQRHQLTVIEAEMGMKALAALFPLVEKPPEKPNG